MQVQKEEKEKSEERKEIDLFFNPAQISELMTKKNEQNANQTPGGGGGGPTSNGSATVTTVNPATTTTTTTTSTGVMIVQQLPIGEQQHYVLPAVNNPAPMIFTTPLGTTPDISLPTHPLLSFSFSRSIDHHSPTTDDIEFRSNG